MTVVVHPVGPNDLDHAVDVLAASFLDNPLEVAVFSTDRTRRREQLRRLFARLIRASPRTRLGGRADGQLVGVLVAAPPGACQPALGLALRLGLDLMRDGPLTALRAARWQLGWRRHHIDQPHSHLILLGVQPEHQGRGIGSDLLATYLTEVDRCGAISYLETDRPQNVTFYERNGYHTTSEARVVGQSNWFMKRNRQSPGSTESEYAADDLPAT